ncbi:ABC transporter ATP-binding protein [Niallia circulans]|uniref:ABC transporter ATP-binding protein n=1 Tax=Niallia circulans TaxID=1397 RepID=A0A553SUD8_NIACI|nr:ABC transporter ATP-binding protein [Niallia circulans]TRZ40603.1 ABC transporter ATP-binding protein [Niallia circulans]
MNNLLLFLKKLVEVTGRKIYLNFFLSLLISALEGIGIYLLVPMLAVIGVFDMQMDNVFPINYIMKGMEKIPFDVSISFVLILYFFLITGQALLQRYQSITNTWIQQNFIKKLRLDLYKSLNGAKWEFFIGKRKSDFNYILTTEIARVGSGTHSVIQLSSLIFFTLIQVMLAFLLSPLLTVIVLVSGTVLAIYMKKFLKGSKTLGRETTDLMNEYFGGITDQFNGIKDMKSNMLEESYFHWFRGKSNAIESNVMKLVRLSSTSTLAYRIAAALLIVMFVYVSLNMMHIANEKVVLIILIFSRLWPKFTSIQTNLEQIIAMLPAVENVLNVQEESQKQQEFKISSQKNHHKNQYYDGVIECKNISYRYDTSQEIMALTNIDICIRNNETTAIVGKSGAGKTTLVDMIMGLLKPEHGQVRINNQPLNDDNLLTFRSSISYVSQDPYLFHTTLRENLLMVRPDASEAEIWESLSFAAAAEFVKKLPLGLDTVIGDRGMKLSGGQRQRIILARAILRKPSILVLDEATSALDSENEKKIQESIDLLKGKMTIIIIAHRLSTIRNADNVIVLEDGKVIQEGAYQRLSQSQGALRNLLNTQELALNQTLA